jgi:hypothetical protein
MSGRSWGGRPGKQLRPGSRNLPKITMPWSTSSKAADSGTCGSLACPKCGRAFQKAKFAAQRRLIKKLAKARPGKQLVMANVIPLWMIFRPDQLAQLDIGKRNRWLKDALAAGGFRRVMFGSADMSWEQGYYQLHWHIGVWTSNPKQLKKRLKAIFPSTRKDWKRRLKTIFPSDTPLHQLVHGHECAVCFNPSRLPPTPADREAAVEPWSGRARSHVAGYRFVAGETARHACRSV